LGEIPADVTFLAVPVSAWLLASPKDRGFGVESLERRARLKVDFDRGMLHKWDI